MCRWEDIVCVQRGGCFEEEREHTFFSPLKKIEQAEPFHSRAKMSHSMKSKCVNMAQSADSCLKIVLDCNNLRINKIGT